MKGVGIPPTSWESVVSDRTYLGYIYIHIYIHIADIFGTENCWEYIGDILKKGSSFSSKSRENIGNIVELAEDVPFKQQYR